MRNPFSYVTFVEALERQLGAATEVVLVGPSAAEMRALERAVAETYVPHLSLVRASGGEQDVPPLARGRRPVDGRATAYVCRHFTCSRPVTSAGELRELLVEAP